MSCVHDLHIRDINATAEPKDASSELVSPGRALALLGNTESVRPLAAFGPEAARIVTVLNGEIPDFTLGYPLEPISDNLMLRRRGRPGRINTEE